MELSEKDKKAAVLILHECLNVLDECFGRGENPLSGDTLPIPRMIESRKWPLDRNHRLITRTSVTNSWLKSSQAWPIGKKGAKVQGPK